MTSGLDARSFDHSHGKRLEKEMFRKLIVGLDGLDGGADALALARTLASEEAEFVLVHAYPYDHRASGPSGLDYEALIRADAEKLLADAAPEDRGTTMLAVADRSPARALHRAAEEQEADLIVIGSCRRSAFGRVLVGDVSHATLHGAPCSVAIAPRDYREQAQPLHSIGVGFDDTGESRAALRLAADLSRDTGAELRVLTAAATPAPFVPGYAYSYDLADIRERYRLNAEQMLDKAVANLDVPANAEMIDESPGLALERLSENVGLVVTGSRGWGAARRVVLGSTSDHLARHASCPVLVVPGPAAGAKQAAGDQAEAAHV